jgi:hypothetical protein
MSAASPPRVSANRGVVRDRTGQLATQLSAHIEEGQELLADGLDVDERPALIEWTRRFRSWHAATTHTLASRFDRLVVEEFDAAAATNALGAGATRTREPERRAVQQAIELLLALRGTQYS